METVKLSSKGQIVIPKEIRDAKRWRAGTRLVITVDAQGLRLVPAPLLPATRAENGLGMLSKRSRQRMTEAETATAIRQHARRQDEASKR